MKIFKCIKPLKKYHLLPFKEGTVEVQTGTIWFLDRTYGKDNLSYKLGSWLDTRMNVSQYELDEYFIEASENEWIDNYRDIEKRCPYIFVEDDFADENIM